MAPEARPDNPEDLTQFAVIPDLAGILKECAKAVWGEACSAFPSYEEGEEPFADLEERNREWIRTHAPGILRDLQAMYSTARKILAVMNPEEAALFSPLPIGDQGNTSAGTPG